MPLNKQYCQIQHLLHNKFLSFEYNIFLDSFATLKRWIFNGLSGREKSLHEDNVFTVV